MAFNCYNMNLQKIELLLHDFFGSACLNSKNVLWNLLQNKRRRRKPLPQINFRASVNLSR